GYVLAKTAPAINPSQAFCKYRVQKNQRERPVNILAIADGKRTDHSLTPNIFIEITWNQISKGGLVFHKSGCPSKYVINQLLLRYIFNAFVATRPSSQILIGIKPRLQMKENKSRKSRKEKLAIPE